MMSKKNKTPESNQKLLERFEYYKAHPSEETETAFIEELETARFLVPIDRTGEEERLRGRLIRFVVIVTPEHENFIPVFTDINEWEKWPFKKEEAVMIAYSDLRQLIGDDPQRLTGILINPFGHNLNLGQELASIDSKAAGAAAEPVSGGRTALDISLSKFIQYN